LYHWISSPQIQHDIRHCGRQTTNISNLDVCRFLDLSFPYPTGGEQRRIAAILDKADAIRRRRRQALTEIDNLLRATFLDMFGDTLTNPLGWPVRELREVVDPARPITYGIVQAGPHVEGGIRYIRTSDFDGHSLRSSGYGMTSPEIAGRFRRSEVRTDDLVFCIRASVGSVARVPGFLNGANLTQGTALIAPGPEVEPDYLLSALQQKGTQTWIKRRQKGATFKEITLATLRETPIPMPPKNLQQRFAGFCIGTSDRRSRMAELNIEAAVLFNSLSQRAFRGEL
jgi:type I restriction enzyme S subunit